MTRLTRVLAYGLGGLLVAGLAVLAVAGVTAVRVLAATAGAVVLLIAVGGLLGGRRPPRASGGPTGSESPHETTAEGTAGPGPGGTMEG